MLIVEYKIRATQGQCQAIHDAIRSGQFIRNKCLRYWMDTKAVGRYDLNNLCCGDDSHYSVLIRQVEQAVSAKQESPGF